MADLAVGVGTGLPLGSLTEFETWFGIVPEQRTRPFPSTRVDLLDESVSHRGSKVVTLYIGGATQASINSYMTAIFGGPATSSVDVTIYCRDTDGTVTLFDAKAVPPNPNESLGYVWHDEARDIILEFKITS